MPLLEVKSLQTHFRTPDGVNRAVDGVSFSVAEGETLAIVGESGCGKSVTAMSILRLIPEPPGKMAGEVIFDGQDLLKLDEARMREIRGNAISMIFQEPMTSLNPVLTIGRQLRKRCCFTKQSVNLRLNREVLKCLSLSGSLRPRVVCVSTRINYRGA